jgi:predicted outer membrane repeat protein
VIFTVPLTATSFDWNCDGQISTDTVSANINADWGDEQQSNDDWNNIVYSGGAIGNLGAALNLPLTTDVSLIDEPTLEDYQAMQAGYLQVVEPFVTVVENNNNGACVADVALDTELSDAINAANTGTGCSTIRLTADIVLGQSPTLYTSEFGDNAFPPITSTIVIDGNEHLISRSNESAAFRFFYVNGRDGSQGNLNLSNLTLDGGQSAAGGAIFVDGSQGGNAALTIVQVIFSNNSSPGGNGGAVATHTVNGGVVNTTFEAVTFNDNSARYGGGFYNGGFDGGKSVSTMINVSFHNNRAEQSGGAIYQNGGGANADAELTTTQSVFVTNSALAGGAIYDNGTNGGRSKIRLNSTAFRENNAQSGDAIFSDGQNGLVDIFTSENVGSGGSVAHCYNDDNGLLTYSGHCG